MSERNIVKHFIPCDCPEGGLLLHGIEFDFNDPIIPPVIYIFNVHSPGCFTMPTIWKRIKNSFSFLFGKSIYTQDIILNAEGVIKLRDACWDVLDRWPDDFTQIDRMGTLDEIYQSMKDEEVGRKLRITSENA